MLRSLVGSEMCIRDSLYISWHAGKSQWEKKKFLNLNSIGIEISNPGHENNYKDFNIKQINSLIFLVSFLKKKYKIKKSNILGHSDVAPDRKKDPGEKFPWKLMYKKKLSIWHLKKESTLAKLRNIKCSKKDEAQFYNNLKMKQIPGFNIGYADRYDTIFYISNGIIPKRAEGYNWKGIVPGDTKKTLWTEYHDIEDLPQVIQPKAGFIYDANHSPIKSTSSDENPKEEDYSERMGYEKYDNNRSTRLIQLIESYDKVSYKDFKDIKYDNSFPSKFNYNFMDISIIETLKINPDNDLFEMLDIIQKWDRKTDIDSQGAGIYGVLYYQLVRRYRNEIQKNNSIVSKEILLLALKDTKTYLINNFGSTNITLGDFQKLVRGDKEIPIWGLPDVITAMSSRPYKNGMHKVTQGESYIGLVRFNKKGPILESIISFGNSEQISNSSDNSIALTSATTSLSGDLTVTGNDITFGNGETISNDTDGDFIFTTGTANGAFTLKNCNSSDGKADIELVSDNANEVGDGYEIKSLNGVFTVTGDHSTGGTYDDTFITVNGNSTPTSSYTTIAGDLRVDGGDIGVSGDTDLITLASGAKAVIQPGGSVKDDEVIKAANEAGISMVFTGTRHFRH